MYKEAFPLKYWVGYLTAAILAGMSWVLMQFGEKFSTIVDMVYPYVIRTLQDMLAQWSGSVDYCLWQMGVMALLVVVIASVVVMIVCKWNPVRWFGWVLAGAALIFMCHTLVWGINYYAGSITDDIRLEERQYGVEELTRAATYYRDMANDLASQVNRDGSGEVDFADFDTLALQAADGFETLVYDYSYSVFAGSNLPVKKLGWADMYTSMGITGVTVGLTGEAAVNPQIPDVTLPFTMCHEMAHRKCIAVERDANFAGFLACMANESVEYQYSGYFMAYRYCYNALIRANTSETIAAAARLSTGVSELLDRDLKSYDAFFASRRSDSATTLANNVNDTYLKASGDEAGVASYDEVSDLLVWWHYQQVILPNITVEESHFDPMDESQVDLSGIINAKETEPVEEGVG